ncbi:MAG: OmpA family protein [Nannocystaceae bacterium]
MERTTAASAPRPSEAPTLERRRCGVVDPRPADLASLEGGRERIQFPAGGDREVSRAGLAEIERIAAVLREYPEICIEIAGHVVKSPDAGAYDYGKDLSLRRAHHVRALLEERGVAGWRLMTRGAGEDEPIESNATREGRRKNERIELMIVTPSYLGEGRAR